MSFQNLQVDMAQLPKVNDVALKPVESTYLKVLRISWTIWYGILLLVIATLVVLVDEMQHVLWLLITIGGYLLLVVLTVVVGTGSFKRKAYAIREKDILYRTGWIWQDLHIIPFNRVQHCVVRSGPIGRKYGLANIGIYTAAGEAKDITLRGLKQEEAEQLKEFIMQHVQPLQA